MTQKHDWLPIDERLVPNIWSFKYPKSVWVRTALVIEMLCAILAVIGTLMLTVLPKTTVPTKINAASSTQNITK